jgi:hypothetical protein
MADKQTDSRYNGKERSLPAVRASFRRFLMRGHLKKSKVSIVSSRFLRANSECVREPVKNLACK